MFGKQLCILIIARSHWEQGMSIHFAELLDKPAYSLPGSFVILPVQLTYSTSVSLQLLLSTLVELVARAHDWFSGHYSTIFMTW